MLFENLDAAHIHAREIENVIDDRQQVNAAAVNVLRVFFILRHGVLAEKFIGENFREPVDGIQRRAQFMGHHREELCLDPVGFFRFFIKLQGSVFRLS